MAKALDPEERAVLNCYRELRRHGYGRLDVVVVAGKLDVIHQAKSYKRDVLLEPFIHRGLDKTSSGV